MYETLKEEVLKANLSLPNLQLVILTWGNVSCIDRVHNVIAIKPSGVSYEHMQLEDIVVVDLDGNIIEGTCKPSSDTMTHVCIYKAFGHISSIVHTHSKWATIWAQANRDIPMYGTTHADYFYGDIPCTKPMNQQQTQDKYEWNTGTHIVHTLSERQIQSSEMNAILVGGHGPFVWGDICHKAIENAVVLENIAEMAFYREQLDHQPCERMPHHLVNRHYFRKHGKNAYYGQ